MANWYTHSWNSDAFIFKSPLSSAITTTLGGVYVVGYRKRGQVHDYDMGSVNRRTA